MNIAELFVNLGIKGAEKTVGALGNVKKGLGEVSSMSLEAKAGLLAALYGFERMMAASGAAGTGLTNFAALTGLSSRTLQEWQYAARQAGVSGEEFTGSLKAVQNSMTNMLLGKGAPEGLSIVSRAVGFDPAKARNAFYVLEQLQKAARVLPQDVGNSVLKSFGLSEGTISAMRRNAFNPGNMKKADVYSDREVAQLDKANIAWSNLSEKVEKLFGHFNAKHGVSLVNDISKISDAVFKMIEAFEKLAEKLKVFAVIGKVFEGWGLLFDSVNSGLDKLDGGSTEKGVKNQGLKKDPVSLINDWMGGIIDSQFQYMHDSSPKTIGAGASNHNTTITQNIIHHGDAKDTKAVGDTHKSAVNQAYRQRSAQRRGS